MAAATAMASLKKSNDSGQQQKQEHPSKSKVGPKMETKKNGKPTPVHSHAQHESQQLLYARCSKYTLQMQKGINKTKRKMLLSCSAAA